MMITILAAAMTLLMLVATVYALHNENGRPAQRDNNDRYRGFGL